MKTSIGLFIIAAMVHASSAVADPSASAEVPMTGSAADLILSNANVKTTTGWAQALAVRDGVIIAVGDSTTITAMGDRTSRRLDLGGATVLPGMHDAHVHPLYAGLNARQCTIPQGSPLAEVQRRIKACVDKAEAGAWITGGQWDASAIGSIPNRAMLDGVAPDNPVLLVDTSAHSSWANSKALVIAGIDSKTPDPEGGIIERESTGAPSGVFREEAMLVIGKHVPAPTQREIELALEWAFNTMLSFGITSFTEAQAGFAAHGAMELKAYTALAEAGVLKQRARLCLQWKPEDQQLEDLITARNLYARALVEPDCVKIVLDGVPIDSHTAAMLQPYVGGAGDRADEASRYGMLLVKQEVLNAAVTRFDRMGLSVKFHAAGDASVRAALDAIEAARNANGFGGQLHDVAHCTFVAQQDVLRARAIGATFEVSPYLWSPTPINDDITAAVGDELVKRVWPVRELIASGALVVPGSDWSVVPSVSPWIGLETLVTREQPGGSEKSFGKEEAITLEQGFDLFTVNAARSEGRSNTIGRIEPGMLADVIVVEKNPFEVPITQVHDTRVKLVFVGGKQVYDAASPPAALAH